jgi:hypothetical protein
VRPAGGLDQVGVGAEPGAELTPVLADLEGVRQPVAGEVVGARRDHLDFIHTRLAATVDTASVLDLEI